MGYSRVLYNLLKKPLDLEKLRCYIEYNERTIAAFLRGLFDSEGNVNEKGEVRILNTDIILLNYVKELLARLKIEVTGPYLGNRKENHATTRKRIKYSIRRKMSITYLSELVQDEGSPSSSVLQ